MELFWQNVRFQIAATAVLVVILYNYFSMKRVHRLSTSLFTLMLLCAGVNLIFDVATVYTITHMSTVPPWANRLCHQVFIATLDLLVYLMYLYVETLGRKEQRLSKWQYALVSIPFFMAIAAAVLGELAYYNDGRVVYSYGRMTVALYFCVAFYMCLANARVLYVKNAYSLRTRRAVRGGIFIWIVVAVIQYFFKGWLISSVAVALMMLHLYLSLEDPSEHYDRSACSFTRRAFEIILAERYAKRKKFCVMCLMLENMRNIKSKYGFSVAKTLTHTLIALLARVTDAPVYLYHDDALCVLLDSEARAQGYLDRLVMLVEKAQTQYHIYLRGHYHIVLLDCPRLAPDADSVLETLDYLAYRTGRTVYIVDDEIVKQKNRRAAIERLVEEALENDGFNVVYQPIFCAPEAAFNSAEALVRLKSNEEVGFVSPEEFIPIAERRGIVDRIDEIVLNKVCDFAARERLWEKGVKYIEVNLSGAQAGDPVLVDTYAAILERYGVPASFLNFEITETCAVEAGEATQSNMRRFAQMGCSFSIDDFGTGYSNLAQLSKMTYDLMKIDKSLIWDSFSAGGAHTFVVLNSVVTMAKKLGKGLVAEGVETQAQAEKLIDMGVDHLQGYFYSRPVPEEQYLAFLAQKNAG
ncbi:MAG: EAL domain-containing protein [Clostridia bacterium]|nr:EAL domain-containing protein [Clostridia bacterium]